MLIYKAGITFLLPFKSGIFFTRGTGHYWFIRMEFSFLSRLLFLTGLVITSCLAEEPTYKELDAVTTQPGNSSTDTRLAVARTLSFAVAGIVALFGLGMLYYDCSRRRKYTEWYPTIYHI